MKIGIHHTKGFFSERWIDYCQKNSIDYKLVDCYSSDIMDQLKDCDALMWHYNHKSPKASKFASKLLMAVQSSGMKVFPDYNTAWHFDDKVAQKYLMEGLDLPLVRSYVFYSKEDALTWIGNTSFPKVFKLRNGAGSDNVKLVRSEKEARKLVKRSFGRGFKQFRAWSDLKERLRLYRKSKADMKAVLRGVVRLFYTTEFSRVTGPERGYIYFQDFIPGNEFDIRVIVIGDKAFAIKRLVRDNDFRASGSGSILYEKEHFDDATIELAFKASEKLQDQCMAYDFVFMDGKAYIVEISYGFSMTGYDPCVGYWDRNLVFHEGAFNPYGWMVDNLIGSLKSSS